jgi:hypothetical protein
MSVKQSLRRKDLSCVVLSPENSRIWTPRSVKVEINSTPELETQSLNNIEFKKMAFEFTDDWIVPWDFEVWIRQDTPLNQYPHHNYHFIPFRLSNNSCRRLLKLMKRDLVWKSECGIPIPETWKIQRAVDRLNQRNNVGAIFPVLAHEDDEGNEVIDSIPHLSLNLSPNVTVVCTSDGFNVFGDEDEWIELRWENDGENIGITNYLEGEEEKLQETLTEMWDSLREDENLEGNFLSLEPP